MAIWIRYGCQYWFDGHFWPKTMALCVQFICIYCVLCSGSIARSSAADADHDVWPRPVGVPSWADLIPSKSSTLTLHSRCKHQNKAHWPRQQQNNNNNNTGATAASGSKQFTAKQIPHTFFISLYYSCYSFLLADSDKVGNGCRPNACTVSSSLFPSSQSHLTCPQPRRSTC